MLLATQHRFFEFDDFLFQTFVDDIGIEFSSDKTFFVRIRRFPKKVLVDVELFLVTIRV